MVYAECSVANIWFEFCILIIKVKPLDVHERVQLGPAHEEWRKALLQPCVASLRLPLELTLRTGQSVEMGLAAGPRGISQPSAGPAFDQVPEPAFTSLSKSPVDISVILF
jgi:hypothetical protein